MRDVTASIIAVIASLIGIYQAEGERALIIWISFLIVSMLAAVASFIRFIKQTKLPKDE